MKLKEQTIKKVRSVRVKAIQLHSNKHICVVGLYNGYIQTWNTTTSTLINETQVTEYPIRTCALVEKNNYILIGADDGKIYVYELTNLRQLDVFDAHDDFIRKIVVHHKNDEFITCSDDGTIKLWRISSTMKLLNTYTGHSHFVMDLCYYPQDNNNFLSCSLDGTIKMWNKECHKCVKTYKGHTKGINTISFCKNDNYFVTGSDDYTLKIWDASSDSCISTLKGHSDNIIHAQYMDKRPYIVSCSEDGTYRVWDLKTTECVEVVNVKSGRIWQFKDKNDYIVVGTDEELIFKKIITSNQLVTMKNKKIFFSYQNAIYSSKIDDMYNIKKISELDNHLSEIVVSDNGKLISVVHENTFEIYSSLGFRKKTSGTGNCFYFLSNDEFLVLDKHTVNFYNKTSFVKSLTLPDVQQVLCFSNYIVGVYDDKSCLYTTDGICIYTWACRITRVVYTQESLLVETKGKVLLYDFNTELVTAYIEQGLEIDEHGIQDALTYMTEYDMSIDSCCVAKNVIVLVSNKKMYYIIIGQKPYLHKVGPCDGILAGSDNDKVFLCIQEQIKYVTLDTEFLDFQMNCLNNKPCVVSENIRIRALGFYESLGLHEKALEICKNNKQKFEILVKLQKYDDAYELCNTGMMYEKLGSVYLEHNNYEKASDCFYKTQNWKSLLFSDILGSKKHLNEIGNNCKKSGDNNFAFIAYMKDKNYSKSAEVLKGTKLYNIFVNTYMNK